MFELLFLGLIFLVACVLYGFLHGFRHYRDERVRARVVARWKERMRVKSLLRLIKGGRDDAKKPDDDPEP
jgi:hypothetical protein